MTQLIQNSERARSAHTRIWTKTNERKINKRHGVEDWTHSERRRRNTKLSLRRVYQPQSRWIATPNQKKAITSMENTTRRDITTHKRYWWGGSNRCWKRNKKHFLNYAITMAMGGICGTQETDKHAVEWVKWNASSICWTHLNSNQLQWTIAAATNRCVWMQ